MIGLLFLFESQQSALFEILPATAVFAILALAAGVLGGLHFALAVKVVAGTAAPSAKTGGGLYGLDLLGAAAGALAAALFLIPVYGLVTTLTALVLLSGGSLLALLPPPANGNHTTLARVLPFMVRYLTTNGESAVYNPTPLFAKVRSPELRRGEKGVLQRLIRPK